MDAPDIGFLTPEEALCLLPAPLPPPDPGRDARRARPLTSAAALDAASANRVLRGLTWTSLALAPHSAQLLLRVAVGHVFTATVMLPFLWINGPAHGFGQRQLAVTVAVIAFENAAYSFGVPLMRWLAWSGGRQPRRDDPEERKPDTVSGGFVKVATLDGWPEAVFWRYNMLRKSASEDSESPFLLLQHRADDLLGCCCPRAECAGSVPRRAATARVAALAIILLLFCFMYITRYFTFLVTLGGQLWTTPWAVAGVLLIPLLLDNEFVSVLGGAAMTDNLVARDLERRLEGRALGHALDSLVAHFRGMVDGGVEGPAAPCESWYLDLVPLLAARWQQDTVLPQMVALAGFFFGTEAIAMVVYITAAGCLPVYTVALLLMGLDALFFPLVNAVYGNGRISQTSAAIKSASLALSRLAARARASPAPAPLADRILAHRAALHDLVEAHVAGAGARLLGVPVTASMARRAAGGTLTAAFALWTVLRALQVDITIECVCGG